VFDILLQLTNKHVHHKQLLLCITLGKKETLFYSAEWCNIWVFVSLREHFYLKTYMV